MCVKCIKFHVLVCIICICWVKSVLSIQCYQCFMAEHPYFIPEDAQVRTCKDFDYSETFVQNCPESTFCFKKTATDYYYKQKFIREERGCAKQLYRGQKFDSSTGWSEVSYIVSDAYQNGCKKVDDFGLKSTKTEECYCSDGNFCNSSQSNKRLTWLYLVPLLTTLLVK